MAVKIWNLDESGVLTSTIRTGNRSGIGGEELRPKAEELDAEIDGVLDEAHKLLKAGYPKGRSKTFAKRWAIGRAIAHSTYPGFPLPGIRTETGPVAGHGQEVPHRNPKQWGEGQELEGIDSSPRG